MMLAIGAIAVTTFLLGLLCKGDPKRRRSARIAGGGSSRAMRWALGLAACLPGIVCLVLSDTAAFLIWMGGCGVAGWLVALLFRRVEDQSDA